MHPSADQTPRQNSEAPDLTKLLLLSLADAKTTTQVGPGWITWSTTHSGSRMLFYRSSKLNKIVEGTEKAMAPHSSTLAWKIPWMEEPGRLQSMGSWRVRHDWATSVSLFTFMCWRRKWQPTPVFLPGESQGRGSLVGCRLWGRTESDTTEVT